MGFQAARLSAELTQEDVGRAVGVKRSTVAMWETGKSMPRADLLPKLALLFRCTVDYLLSDSKEAPQ